MTLGIAAHGPQAGAAVRQAVIAAELLGRGEIGGFAVFAVIDAAGQVHHCWGQQGGITALQIPPAWLAATHAAVITSGPERPEPLMQFLPGRDGVGLVTGHRLPNRPGAIHQEPLNQRVLALLATGLHPQAAVDQMLAAHPQADAGLIAINALGQIGCGNSARVQQRGDTGAGLWHSTDEAQTGFAFLHNAIQPAPAVAECVQSVLRAALDQTEHPARYQMLQLTDVIPVEPAAADAVYVDAQWRVERVASADPFMAQARQNITLLPLAMPVWQAGRCVGRMATELFAQVAHGRATPAAAGIANLALVKLQPR
ncbi:DUF6963 family protein [Comamonas sp. 4034]|uniref:DUF6963 family protein n=1 Tax=Comamonas sp. 4034 TaxID=3156455 RepID=UPI003D20D14C